MFYLTYIFLSDEEENLTPTQAKCCLLLGLYTIDIDSRWREIKYQSMGALGSVAASKNVRSKRLLWGF
jgi:hypothetical protein